MGMTTTRPQIGRPKVLRPLVTAWTDGAVSGNPGPAGWAVLIQGELISDWLEHATNNEMELWAIYQALVLCPSGADLVVITDSKLAIGWLGRGWQMNTDGCRAIKQAIKAVLESKDVTLSLEKTKGHASDPGNIEVDRAASGQAQYARNRLLYRERDKPAAV